MQYFYSQTLEMIAIFKAKFALKTKDKDYSEDREFHSNL